MKIRAGFVSNSSSASFVIVGVKMTSEELDKIYPGYLNDDDCCVYDKIQTDGFFIEPEEDLFGITIAYKSSDEEMKSKIFTLDDFEKMAQRVCDKTGKTDIKIYTGEMSC